MATLHPAGLVGLTDSMPRGTWRIIFVVCLPEWPWGTCARVGERGEAVRNGASGARVMQGGGDLDGGLEVATRGRAVVGHQRHVR